MKTNEIWVIAEIRKGSLTRVTSQLIGAARTLADAKGLGATAVLLGGEEKHAGEMARLSPKVIWVRHPALDPYEATRHLAALSLLIDSRGTPSSIMAGASASGLELLPRLAARLGTGYASHCVKVWWEENQLAVKRPVYGGRAYEDLAFSSEPAVLTIRPGAFSVPSPLPQTGEIRIVEAKLPDKLGPDIVERKATATGKIELTEATRIVSGGRGMGKPENFRLIEDLAEALGAAVGASRAVVDSGWRPYDEQVGKSGKTVSPELYIAAGISGAIHHVLGINTSKVVVAINTDPEALIFKNANFGIVGDATQVVPEIIKAVRK